MSTIHNTISFIIVSLMSASCATQPTVEPHEMRTCVEGAVPAEVESADFVTALKKAQMYSEEVYGEDCFVCAEVFDDTDTYMLHITSPIEDMFINTSAAITIRKSDGKVIRRGMWHSCKARIKP